MRKILASVLVVPLNKTLGGIPPSLCGTQVIGSRGLPVAMAKFDKRFAKRALVYSNE